MHHYLQLQASSQQPQLADTSPGTSATGSTNKKMEKLLSTQGKGKTNNAGYLMGQRKKIFPLAVVGYRNIFCQPSMKNFFKQPYSG